MSAALIFECFDAGDKKSEETVSLGTWLVQRVVRKESSLSQKWAEVHTRSPAAFWEYWTCLAA